MIKFKTFKTNDDGNVAMMFALSLAMIGTLIAVAIDYTNMSRLQNQLRSQVDAGVLAAATLAVENRGKNGEEKSLREDAALKVLSANGFSGDNLKPLLDLKDTSVTLTATLDYTPFFGRFLGKNSVKLTAVSEAGLPKLGGAEIVLVLDNTDSMSVDGKMDALKEGAISLVKAIEDSNSDSKIGMVPFARYVRLPKSVKSEGWFKMPGEYDTPRTWQQATHTGGTCVPVTRTRERDGVTESYETTECTGQTTTYETQSKIVESRWEGCVGTRPPPFNERDDSYVSQIPGLLNKIPHEVSGLNWDINSWCPAEIVPLTNEYDDLKNKVSWLWPTDNTYLPIGLIWGQRLLSAGTPFDNKDSDANKIMILMTDGRNTLKIDTGALAEHEYRAPPRISNVSNASSGSPDADAVTARLCENIKDSNIEIYTIAFQVKDSNTKNLLRGCASHPSKALTADNNKALVKQFENISNAIKDEVRLMR